MSWGKARSPLGICKPMAITLARALKNRVPRVDMKREPVINPAIARPLLGLQRARHINSFSKAAQQLLSVAIPNRLIRLTLQHNPVLPTIVRPARSLFRRLFRYRTVQKLYRGKTPQKIGSYQRSFFKSRPFDEIDPLSPLHGATKLWLRRGSLFLERWKTHLRNYHHARIRAGRSIGGGDEITSAALPAIACCSSPALVAQTRTHNTNGL